MNTYHNHFPTDWQRMGQPGEGAGEMDTGMNPERRVPMYPNQPLPLPIPSLPPVPSPVPPGAVQPRQLQMHSGLDLDALDCDAPAIIKELGEKGPCVIVGRCADYVLRDKRNVVKVFIYAPLDDRIRRKMALGTEGNNEKDVKKNILAKEKIRERYYNFYTGARWGDSRNYNLCIDTSKVGIDGAVEIIAAYVDHERQHSILPDMDRK